MSDYELLDSGQGKKLERFGPFIFSRPAGQALWKREGDEKLWNGAHGVFSREEKNHWLKLPEVKEWTVSVSKIQFKLSATDFGHLGIFPEQAPFWSWIQKTLKQETEVRSTPLRVLNLFAYSGGSTLAAALGGAEVCHLDASLGMVSWARENALLNGLEKHPIRWIVEDVKKFLKREERRGSRYDGIILDPPSFGRGTKGEVFKIEDELPDLLKSCVSLFSKNPLFLLLSCHTPGLTPLALHHILKQALKDFRGNFEGGEMVLSGKKEVFPLPSGTFVKWVNYE